ncbi:drug/metabolite transporter (DMT)-like permease [Angulomicrobium tetraedrale]|uniref:Drug/metabolite transporter (DMT)-like permease n=1 Tax=Ancylobacter tetraedralis TaxID=217068 RepID=A0A839ZC55_9HYPH|nr:DMT family transporter [Ancylobacter tetraedralis]MBB3772353.1 drug/metabolite transporter (DMT)-like permease [Ancylobacter tetraedralis]
MFRRLLDAPYLMLTLAPLFWSGNIVLGRYVAGQVPPMALAWVRWVLAFLILLPFTWRHLRADWPVIRTHMGVLTLLSLSGITLYNTLYYWALQYSPALNGLLMTSTAPLLIAGWAFLLLGERLSLGQAGGIGLSLAGVLVILCRGDLGVLANIDFNIGDVLFLTAVLLYALYSALLARRPTMSRYGFLAFSLGWGGAMLTPAFIWERISGPPLHFDLLTLASFAYVAVFASVLAYLFFNRGVELVGPNRAAPFFHLMPVFGSALAILFLGETPHLYHAVGYALVLGGVVTATLFGRRAALSRARSS